MLLQQIKSNAQTLEEEFGIAFTLQYTDSTEKVLLFVVAYSWFYNAHLSYHWKCVYYSLYYVSSAVRISIVLYLWVVLYFIGWYFSMLFFFLINQTCLGTITCWNQIKVLQKF